LLEGATTFNRILERKYEMSIASYAAGLYPDPYPFFDSIFLKTTIITTSGLSAGPTPTS